MRLIDADNFYIPKGFFNDGINVPKMFKLLKMQSTIDPATLRPHGEWIKRCITSVDSPDVSECSICKYPVSTMWGKTNYCPNCGADMRGEKE